MARPSNPVPEGFRSVTPYLCIDGAAGAREIMPLSEQPYGLSGGLQDPFGILWWVTTP